MEAEKENMLQHYNLKRTLYLAYIDINENYEFFKNLILALNNIEHKNVSISKELNDKLNNPLAKTLMSADIERNEYYIKGVI